MSERITIGNHVVTVAEASVILGIPVNEVYRLVKRGEIPFREKSVVSGIPAEAFSQFARSQGKEVSTLANHPVLMA